MARKKRHQRIAVILAMCLLMSCASFAPATVPNAYAGATTSARSSLQDAEITMNGLVFTESVNDGVGLEPNLTVKLNAKTLVRGPGNDYYVDAEIRDNKIVATVHGIGSYSGNVVKEYPLECKFEGGFKYVVVDGLACILSYEGASNKVDVPQNLGGLSTAYVAKYAFSEATSVREIAVPGTVKAFSRCALAAPNLQKATLGEGVSETGKLLFMGCDQLETVNLPSSLRSYWSCMFTGCASLSAINVSETNPRYCTVDGSMYSKDKSSLLLYANGRKDKTFTAPSGLRVIANPGLRDARHVEVVNLPNGVTEIGATALRADCIRVINIGPSVTTIDDYAFSGGKGLREINVDASNPSFSSVDGVLFSKDERALLCLPPSHQKREFTFQKTTEIGKHAFSYISNKTVIFENTINTVGASAFNYCSKVAVLFKNGLAQRAVNSDCFWYSTLTLVGDDSVAEAARVNGQSYKTIFEFEHDVTQRPPQENSEGKDEGGQGSVPPATSDDTAHSGKPQPGSSSSTSKWTAISAATIAVKSKTYTGKAQKCAVPTVKVGGKTLRHKVDFIYSCKAGKAVGSYKVKVVGKGVYTGTKTAVFKIVPKGTSVSKLVKAKKAFTVKWKKPSKANLKQTTGYQVRWSASKKFTKKTTKTKTVKATTSSGKKCQLKVSKLKAGKKYYVQVRTYKKAGGKTYYSSWSKAKAVKTRK